MISIVIPYYSNNHGLAVLLTLLQQQTMLPHTIIVLDSSPSENGKEIVDRYSVNMNIKYVKHRGTIYEAWNAGLSLQKKGSIAFLNDDVLVPLTFIEYLHKVSQAHKAYSYVPDTPSIEHREKTVIGNHFKWIQHPHLKIKNTSWLTGFCFILTRSAINTIGTFDTNVKIWFGDFDYQERILDFAKRTNTQGIIRIQGLYVYHYGTSSYKLYQRKVRKQINKDRKYFNQKYNAIPNYSDIVEKRIINETKNLSLL